jgi:hypothetical protein
MVITTLALSLILFTPTPCRNDSALRNELLARKQKDAAGRAALERHLKSGATNLPDELHTTLLQVDEDNSARLKEILATYGWPGRSCVGDEGAAAAWLLAQHADHDRALQRLALTVLRQAVDAGEASALHLAYLTDRVEVAESGSQTYGTQMRASGAGAVEPFPIKDEAQVDARRKAVGLGPLQEALRKMRGGG